MASPWDHLHRFFSDLRGMNVLMIEVGVPLLPTQTETAH